MTNLQSFHTFSLPARAANLLAISDIEQLLTVDYSQPFYVLGQGSNTLFIEDFSGTVLRIVSRGITKVAEDEHSVTLDVAAGEDWSDLVRWTSQQGWHGLENLILIPGTAGAAPVQNIGAYGVEFQQYCVAVQVFDTQSADLQWLPAGQCQFQYRDSIFKHSAGQGLIITAIRLRLSKQFVAVRDYGPLQQLAADCSAKQVLELVTAVRKAKLPDPARQPNAGSFFKNPLVDAATAQRLLCDFPAMPSYPQADGNVKLAAGWLIEQAGLKGWMLGHFQVHPMQALVLIHLGGGNGDELLQFASAIQQRVLAKFNVRLEPEVRMVAAAGLLTAAQVEQRLTEARHASK